MKKILLAIISILMLTGCMSENTPTSKVEALLNKYNSNDESIVTELKDYLNGYDLTDETKSKYENVYLKQFKDLTYEIKEEEVDGDKAEVTAQISVYDYSQIIFSTLLGFFLFGEIPDGYSVIGYVTICGTAILLFLYNTGRLGRKNT